MKHKIQFTQKNNILLKIISNSIHNDDLKTCESQIPTSSSLKESNNLH